MGSFWIHKKPGSVKTNNTQDTIPTFATPRSWKENMKRDTHWKKYPMASHAYILNVYRDLNNLAKCTFHHKNISQGLFQSYLIKRESFDNSQKEQLVHTLLQNKNVPSSCEIHVYIRVQTCRRKLKFLIWFHIFGISNSLVCHQHRMCPSSCHWRPKVRVWATRVGYISGLHPRVISISFHMAGSRGRSVTPIVILLCHTPFCGGKRCYMLWFGKIVQHKHF